jgi:hypothetical protein
LAFFRNRASGVLLSALNVRWQARHLKRCKPLALPLRTIRVLAQCGQDSDWASREFTTCPTSASSCLALSALRKSAF